MEGPPETTADDSEIHTGEAIMTFTARAIMGFMGRTLRCAPIPAMLLATATLALAFTSDASADPTNIVPSDFAVCPTSFMNAQPDAFACVHSVVSSGFLHIGNSTVPIAQPGDTVDFGTLSPPSTSNLAVITPTNGQVFGGPAQTVPGGLLGLLGMGSSSSAVSASFELAGATTPSTDLDPTATTVFFNDTNAVFQSGTILNLPVKIQLHNPLLGPSCTLGSNSNPIMLSLQDGTTSPPPPNQPISGVAGGLSILDGGNVLGLTGSTFVDNSFGVPGASGCGIGGSLDRAINSKENVPSRPGRNAAVLNLGSELAVTCFAEGTC
jgi:hypothetical protein